MDKERLKILQETIKTLQNGVTKEEFLASFKSLMAVITKAIQDLNVKADAKTASVQKELENLKGEFQQVISQAQKDSESTFGQIKQRAMEVVQNALIKSNLNKKLGDILATAEAKIAEVDAKLAEVKNGDPGLPGEPGANGSPDTPIQVRDKLETLQGDERLDKTAIKGLEELIKKILSEQPVRSGGGGVSAMGVAQAFKYIAHTEAPSGLINGSNTIYTVKNTIWWIAGFTLNGEQVAELPNFTYSGHTITFSVALPAAYSGKDFEIKYIGT